MVPSYGPLETIQLLSEIFFSPGLGFRDVRLDGLKWATLYMTQDKCNVTIALRHLRNISATTCLHVICKPIEWTVRIRLLFPCSRDR